MEKNKKRDPFKSISFKGTPVSKQEYLDDYDSYVKRCSASRETGHDQLKELEIKSNKNNSPMKDWSRVIIETDESTPKTIAIVTNDDFELADGFRVRLKPVYKD